MKLTYVTTTEKILKGGLNPSDAKMITESRMVITIDYDPKTEQIDLSTVTITLEEQNVWVVDRVKKYSSPLFATVDATELLADTLTTYIENINWEEIYQENKYTQL